MSISNFSQKKTPNEEFLHSLEKELSLKAVNSIKAFEGLTGNELTNAQLTLAFELEKLRLTSTVKFCDVVDYINFVSHEKQNMRYLVLDRKWLNITVLEKKLVVKQSSNSDLMHKRKSELIHQPITNTKNHRKSVNLPHENNLQKKSIFENLDISQLRNSKVIGLGLTLAGKKKSRDYSIIPGDADSDSNCPHFYNNDNSSEENFENSLHSGSDETLEDEDEMEIDLSDELIKVPVISIVKQNRNVLGFQSDQFVNVSNPFAFDAFSMEKNKNEAFKFSTNDENKFMAFFFFDSRFIKTQISKKDQKHVAILPKELICSNAENKVIIRNSEKFFESLNLGSSQKYNSLQGKNDQFCLNSHLFDRTIKFYKDSIKQSIIGELENEVSLCFDKPDFFGVKICSGFYGAYLNLGLGSFDQNLLLEEGMLFLTNEKRGLAIQTIVSSLETQKKAQLLIQSAHDDYAFVHCANLKLSCLNVLLTQMKEEGLISSDIDLSKNSGINRALKKLFFDRLSVQNMPILVLSKVEFHQQYKLFQWKEQCLIFQLDFEGTPFDFCFEKVDCGMNYCHFGQGLFKSQGDLKYRTLMTNFMAPYDVQINYHSSVDRFSLSYPWQKASSFVNLFDSQVCDLKWSESNTFNRTKFELAELTSEEGLWVLLTKFDLFEEQLSSKSYVNVPYGSMLMINQIVYYVDQKDLSVVRE